jgi:hypothetical protein
VRSQQIKPSQFVITYGPGAIIEGKEGPRVILSPEIGLFGSDLSPDDFEISDQRMSHGLLGGARIYRLPTNAELGLPADRYIYKTKPFPQWKLCLNLEEHKGGFYVLYHGSACPVCKASGRKGREAIRFIKACSDGHMDEVDWYVIAHGRGSACTHNSWFKWYGGGGSLSEVYIECPVCGSRKYTLGQVYQWDWPCSGRFPEKEVGPQRFTSTCDKPAKIIQRQASNLRIPELLTLFSIPPRHTRLHNLLQTRPIYENLVGSRPSSLQELKRILQNLANAGLIKKNLMDEILRYPWGEIAAAINDVLEPIKASYHELIVEEFHAFVDGSVNGIPPIRGPKPRSPVLIEINPHTVRRFKGPNGHVLRVTPVSRLRTVIVQRGYYRTVGTGIPKLIDVSFPDPRKPDQKWYPGVEFFGEGIFIMMDPDDGWGFSVTGKAADRWMRAFSDPSNYPDHLFRDSTSREELHPLFVWWHTFSHSLIRALSCEAGYSSTSIRERVYVEISGERARGGVLLYATQPGSEGTLGGLVAMAPYFQDIIDIAIENIEYCSGDPLCLEQEFQPGSYNGSACYGCLLLSETSCEHRNMWLDRNVFLESLP